MLKFLQRNLQTLFTHVQMSATKKVTWNKSQQLCSHTETVAQAGMLPRVFPGAPVSWRRHSFLESKVYRNRFDLVFHKSKIFFTNTISILVLLHLFDTCFLFSLKFVSNECILHRTVLFGHKANIIWDEGREHQRIEFTSYFRSKLVFHPPSPNPLQWLQSWVQCSEAELSSQKLTFTCKIFTDLKGSTCFSQAAPHPCVSDRSEGWNQH